MKAIFPAILLAVVLTGIAPQRGAAEPATQVDGVMARLLKAEKELDALRARVVELEKVVVKPEVNGPQGKVMIGNLLIQWGVLQCSGDGFRKAEHKFKHVYKDGAVPWLLLSAWSSPAGPIGPINSEVFVPSHRWVDVSGFTVTLENVTSNGVPDKSVSVVNWVAIGEVESPK